MLLEDFLSDSYDLRGNLSDIARSTASENRVIWTETKNIENIDASSISQYLLFPNTDDLEITEEDKQFVRKILDKMAFDINERIICTTAFFHDFNRIYIRYKHALPVIIGLHDIFSDGTDSNKKLVSSKIYVRDYLKGKPSTYILYTGLEILGYYQKMVHNIGVVSDVRLFAYLHNMFNCGRPFLVPIEFYVKDGEK